MKISHVLYLIILPLLMTPSLNASKDLNEASNIESVVYSENLEDNLNPMRQCRRDLRSCEAANRYLEKELLVMEDELTRSKRKMRNMARKLRDYENKMQYMYKNDGPRRPNAHGYDMSRKRSRAKQNKKYKHY